MEQPERALTRELAQLRNALNTLEQKLKLTKQGPQEEFLDAASLERLPDEVILLIIDERIPHHFENAQQIINTINSMLSFVNTSKRFKEQFENYVKTKLSRALQASKEISVKPKYPGFAEHLERNPILKEQQKIINEALLLAFQANNLPALRILLENGANVDTEYIEGLQNLTLLMIALAQQNIAKVNFLLSFVNEKNGNAILNHRTINSDETPLQIAIENNFVEGIEALFKAALKNYVRELDPNLTPNRIQQIHGLLWPKLMEFYNKYNVRVMRYWT